MSKHNFSYKKYQVYFNNVDVTDMVLCVNLYYDIQSPVLTANVYMMDSSDLLTTMNLTGGDVYVRVEFSCVRNGKEYEIMNEYFIESIRDKVQQNQKTMMYTVACVSDTYRTFLNTRIAKQLKGLPTDLVASIIKQYTGVTVNTVPASNQINMSSNNETLMNVLSKLIKNSVKDGRAGYLLYQTSNQTMEMSTIDSLPEKSSDQTFYYTVTGTTAYNRTNTENRHNVLKYEVIHPEQTQNVSNGYNGNTTNTYDIMNKTVAVKSVLNDKQVDSESRSNQPSSNKNVLVSAAGLLPNASQLENPSSVRSTRKMELLRLEQEKVIVQVEGHIDLCRHIGKSSVLDMPVQSDSKSYSLDSKRSGEYIISAQEHSFNRQHYVTNVELTKLSMT